MRTDSNGFYYMSIMDYPRVAPHNNVFIHGHRKVAMDGYNRYKYTGTGLLYCNPATGQYEPYSAGTGNGVNAIFMTDDRRYPTMPGTEYLMESECGFKKAARSSRPSTSGPNYCPGSPTFAVERRGGAYTMEMSGVFAHVGKATFRYTRSFVRTASRSGTTTSARTSTTAVSTPTGPGPDRAARSSTATPGPPGPPTRTGS